jgi:hypothetical protein
LEEEKMSYSDQSAYYEDSIKRGRIDMCVREQALIFVDDPRPEVAKLAADIVANQYMAVSGVTASVIVGPNFATLDDDGAVLASVQATFPVVAAATHPDLVVPA